MRCAGGPGSPVVTCCTWRPALWVSPGTSQGHPHSRAATAFCFLSPPGQTAFLPFCPLHYVPFPRMLLCLLSGGQGPPPPPPPQIVHVRVIRRTMGLQLSGSGAEGGEEVGIREPALEGFWRRKKRLISVTRARWWEAANTVLSEGSGGGRRQRWACAWRRHLGLYKRDMTRPLVSPAFLSVGAQQPEQRLESPRSSEPAGQSPGRCTGAATLERGLRSPREDPREEQAFPSTTDRPIPDRQRGCRSFLIIRLARGFRNVSVNTLTLRKPGP